MNLSLRIWAISAEFGKLVVDEALGFVGVGVGARDWEARFVEECHAGRADLDGYFAGY